CLYRCFSHSHSSFSKFICKINQQNSILYYNASETNNAYHYHDQWHAHARDRESQKHTNDTEENFRQYYKRFAQRVELQHKYSKDHPQSNDQCSAKKSQGLRLLFLLTCLPDRNIIWFVFELSDRF